MNYPTGTATPTVRAHLTARLFTSRLDQQLAVGAIPHAGTALALHAERLRSDRERHAIARSLRRAVEEARSGRAPGSSMVAVHRGNVRASGELIDAITLQLHAPRRISAIGMARLRRILADGQGPMYHGGAGDLVGRLAAALAAL